MGKKQPSGCGYLDVNSHAPCTPGGPKNNKGNYLDPDRTGKPKAVLSSWPGHPARVEGTGRNPKTSYRGRGAKG